MESGATSDGALIVADLDAVHERAHRAWSVQRRGRYEWVRTANEWQLRRVEVLAEEVQPARTWLGFE